MNYSDRNKILIGGFLLVVVTAAVVLMLVNSKSLLAIKQAPVPTSDVAQSTPQDSGQVLGDSTQNPLKDIYINPFVN